jgi:ankyrin repeat protein
MVKLLLAKDGVDPDSKDPEYGQTPLSWAARNGHEAVVKSLLNKGADVNAQGRHDGSALQAAAWNGHRVVALMLLYNGADYNKVDVDERGVEQLSETLCRIQLPDGWHYIEKRHL